jgi:hypothetical protein
MVTAKSAAFNPPRVRLTGETIRQQSGTLVFKTRAQSFIARLGRTGKRKTLKQLMLAERFALVPAHLPTYASVRAPVSVLPAAKYCDLTGLPTNFTDPKTKLHYVDSATFQRIRQLNSEAINRILAKRGADTSI